MLCRGGRMVVATPNRHSLGVIRRKLADRLRRRRRPPSAYYAAESHLREYTWAEFERVLCPHLIVRDARAWDGPTAGFGGWSPGSSRCRACAGSLGCWWSSSSPANDTDERPDQATTPVAPS